MFLIHCPHCGPRDETEFAYGGEAHIARPKDPDALSDAEWADYLFMRTNPKGRHRERWVHIHGCRRWFNMERDTVTHEVTAVYGMGERPPSARGAKAPAKRKAAKKKPAAMATSGKEGGAS